MKSFILPTYTFTPGTSGVGTVNLTGISSFNIKRLIAIINQTRGITIYATGSTSLRYTNVVGTTITLFYDTSSQNSGDTLQVIYEDTTDTPISATSLPLPTGASTSALQTTGNSTLSTIDGKLPATLGQKTMTNSMAVVIASDQTPLAENKSSTATLTNVSASASSVTVIASNTSRLGAIIYNDSSATLYLKFGSTASTSSFTYLIPRNSTWEMPTRVYTGIITGIWTSATGTARVTELS